ncbi:MAG: ABC transporter permease [Alistipes sp.]|nr:ABC transporter permease [Alistipes sp.]
MRQFTISFNDEIKRIASDKIYCALLFILPAISLLFFVCYFSGDSIRELPIVVVDNNKSTLSRKLIEMIDATSCARVDYIAASSDEAFSIIRKGRAYAAVIIPHSFQADIITNTPTKVALYNSGVNISTNGFIAKDIQSVVATFSAGIELQRGVPFAKIMAVGFDKHILFNPYLSYTYYLSPCFMPMMITIFTMLATAYAIAQREGREICTLLGRIFPTTLTMWIFAAIMLIFLFRVLGVPLKGSKWIVLLSTLLLVTVYQAIAILFTALTHNRHLSLSLGGGYSVLAFTLSGLTFPTMAMFPILKFVSHLFPFTFYMKIMVDQAIRGTSGNSATDIGYMSLFLLLPILVRKRL